MSLKILVTGSDGFIGQHVVKLAEARGHEVHKLDRKSRLDISQLPAYWFADYDVVIHLAASIDISESIDKPWKYVEDNINALKKLKQAKRVVFASSAAVYGEYSPYGYTKRLGESLLPKNSISLRLFNPFGPGENHEKETHIIPLLAEAGSGGKGVTLYQRGMQIRDFIYIDDVARAFVLSAESNATGTFDLCNEPIAIRVVANIMNVPYALDKSLRDSGDSDILVGDNRPLTQTIGWKPEVDVREKLKNWRDWYNSSR